MAGGPARGAPRGARRGSISSSPAAARTRGSSTIASTRIVLLSAPVDVMVARIEQRTDNPFGKSEAERERILADLAARRAAPAARGDRRDRHLRGTDRGGRATARADRCSRRSGAGAVAEAPVHDARQQVVERHEEDRAERRLQRVGADRVLAVIDDVDQGGQHDEHERRALDRALQRRSGHRLPLDRRACRRRSSQARARGEARARRAARPRRGPGVASARAPCVAWSRKDRTRLRAGSMRSARHPSSAHSPSQNTCLTRGLPRW